MNCFSEIVRDNGILKVKINDTVYTPLSFKSFRPNPQNVSEFYNAGIRLFSVLTSGITSALGVPYSLYGESWIDDEKYDFSVIDKQMDMFIENAPDAYFAPMIQLDTREWYLKKHPNIPNSFTHLSQIACDQEWKTLAAKYLKAAITHIEEKYGNRVYGYFMLCGTTTEWFSDYDYEEANTIKNNGYKLYMNDENAVLPSKERLDEKGDVFLEEGYEDIYSARRFHNELIADLILYFSKEAQSIIKRKKLLGLYYGYLFELGGERLYNAGSLGYEKVYLSEDINMISSPSSYGYRKIDDPSAFMVTQKTLDAHDKLYFLEFDHITHTAPEGVSDSVDGNPENMKIVLIPGANSKCKDEIETLNLMYRDFILCMANGTALWWFDMFDGWFRSEGMMSAVKKMINIADEIGDSPSESIAQVAVFAEGEAMYRARKTSNIASVCLSDIRRTLAKCGAPYDIYSISDLSVIDTAKYKMYIFLNQYDIKPEMRREIEDKCKKDGKTVLWMYAPDYANAGKLNTSNISAVSGISVEASKVSHGSMIYKGDKYQSLLNAPYFSICDGSAKPLAFFEDQSVAVAEKNSGRYKSIYCALCNMPSTLLRDILDQSEIFLYSRDSLVYTYTNSNITGVYNASGKACEIYLREDGVYRDLISNETFQCKNGVLKIKQGQINAFLLQK